MDKNSDIILSRRSFFRKAAEQTLPILGVIVLSHVPLNSRPLISDEMGCNEGCKGGCTNSCRSGCKTSCAIGCTGGNK